jgi:hypothetical protein
MFGGFWKNRNACWLIDSFRENNFGSFAGPGYASLCTVLQFATNAPWRLLIKTIAYN